jgi:Domain of unknown function (DUF4105)
MRMLRRWSGWVLALSLSILTALLPRSAHAEPPSRVSVLTMGPGDHPFTRFGHNAILLEWEGEPPDRARVYNFGTFAFDGLNGVHDFMSGRFRYWLSVTNLGATRRAYGRANRSLTAQDLELTIEERAALFDALETNALPAHRYYDYDYYRDNCSTRVRDALDRLLGGELKNAVHGRGRFSFRQHTLRLVGDEPLLYFGLDVALGRPTDRSISRWEELFLPQELHDELATTERDLGGRRVPLVRRERRLLEAVRAPLATEPPARGPWYAAIGLGAGGVLFGLGLLGERSRGWRLVLGLLGSGVALALGLLGLALLIFSLSKHSAAHWNVSLLGLPPWGLVIAWHSVRCGFGRVGAAARLALWLAAPALTSCALLALSLPEGHRESLRLAMLCLPLWTGWWLGVARCRGVIGVNAS